MNKDMNKDIRDAIKAAWLYQWQVAEACGVSEWTFVRWLRHELSEERREAVFKAIEKLSKKGE